MNGRVAYMDHDRMRCALIRELARGCAFELKVYEKLEDLPAADSWQPHVVVWHCDFAVGEIPSQLQAAKQWQVGGALPKWPKVGHHLKAPWDPEELINDLEQQVQEASHG